MLWWQFQVKVYLIFFFYSQNTITRAEQAMGFCYHLTQHLWLEVGSIWSMVEMYTLRKHILRMRNVQPFGCLEVTFWADKLRIVSRWRQTNHVCKLQAFGWCSWHFQRIFWKNVLRTDTQNICVIFTISTELTESQNCNRKFNSKYYLLKLDPADFKIEILFINHRFSNMIAVFVYFNKRNVIGYCRIQRLPIKIDKTWLNELWMQCFYCRPNASFRFH